MHAESRKPEKAFLKNDSEEKILNSEVIRVFEMAFFALQCRYREQRE